LSYIATKKQNENKLVQRSLYKPKLLHFFNFEQKTQFRSNVSSKKRDSGKTLTVTMAILISFWSTRDHLSPYYLQITLKENARAFWAILQFSNSLPSSQNYRAVGKFCHIFNVQFRVWKFQACMILHSEMFINYGLSNTS
jgi:hypothetical protein